MPPAVIAVALSHMVPEEIADGAPDAPPAQMARAGMRGSASALIAVVCKKDLHALGI